MQTYELREYQVEFEKFRDDVKPEYKKLLKLLNRFRKDYPIEKILSFSLDDFVTGKGTPTFCNRLENELNALGDIHGSTAKKFGIYYGVDGNDKEKKYRIGKRSFGSKVNDAFKKVKYSIVEVIENDNNFDLLKKNLISPMFKGKLLSVYFPSKFLNIYSATHLNYFINVLGLENDSKFELEKQYQLLRFKDNDLVMKDWSIFEFSKFLYQSFGKPNNELKEDRLPKELTKYKLKDFPPIEDVKEEFVDLQTDKLAEDSKITNNKSRKTDHSAQSKRFKQIGDRGEQIVVRAERKILMKEGKNNLAKKVDQISIRDDSIGYDIRSYDIDGKEKYIEVKSTLKSAVGICNVFISANELEIAKNTHNYYFYIVYDAGAKNPKIWKIKGTDFLNDSNIETKPIQYKVKMRIK